MPGAVLSPGDLAVKALGACSCELYVLLEESEEKKQENGSYLEVL